MYTSNGKLMWTDSNVYTLGNSYPTYPLLTEERMNVVKFDAKHNLGLVIILKLKTNFVWLSGDIFVK